MYNSRFVCVRCRAACLIAMAVGLVVARASAQQAPECGPTLDLEKQVYLIDEAIRFWIGVRDNSDACGFHANSTGVVHWLNPDGTRLNEAISPVDDANGGGWLGGWGFGRRTPELGRYLISFEAAGKSTEERSFEVIRNPFKHDPTMPAGILASWLFVDTLSGGEVHSLGAVLHIENHYTHALRFSYPGFNGTEAWVEVKDLRTGSSDVENVPLTSFIPEDQIACEASNDLIPCFSSKWVDGPDRRQRKMIVLLAGGSKDIPVDLAWVVHFQPGHTYDVALDTVVTVEAHGPEDPNANLFPIRMPVHGSKRF
jgi:hypothetical protein